HVLIAPMLGKVQWPESARRAVEKRLRDRSVVRAILLDFVIDEEGGAPWPDAPVEKSRIARIDYRKWAEIEDDGTDSEEQSALPDSGEQSLSVKAARLCAAVLGHAAALGRGLEPNHWQKSAVGHLLRLIGSQLPAAAEFTYLPNAAQRHILDLAAWSGGALLNLKQMGDGVRGDSVKYLTPHYLIKEGSRWRRQPALDNPLAKIMREVLKRTRDPVTEQSFAEIARKELLLAQRDELAACVSWLADKFVEEGEADRRFDGFMFINLDADIKQLRRDITSDQRRLKEELRRLMVLRRERWVPLKD